ncbi:serine protease [Thoreauomyces humboldtii]|nr:serine protease [Thoreauomyces humboldtii]
MWLPAFLPSGVQSSAPGTRPATSDKAARPAGSPAAVAAEKEPSLVNSVVDSVLTSANQTAGSLAADRYLIALHPSADMNEHLAWLESAMASVTSATTADRFAGLLHTFSHGMQGYSAHVPPAIATLLSKLHAVQYIEQDAYVSHYTPLPKPGNMAGVPLESSNTTLRATAIPITAAGDLADMGTSATQASPPWGLTRISHRQRTDQGVYVYPVDGGNGVDIYVLDSGCYTAHPDFEGRARFGATFSPDGEDDGFGHGTHVSGTAASKTYGVAKAANIVAVKVLNNNGGGLLSQVASGLHWVASQIAAQRNATANMGNSTRRGAVINMSLGGGGTSKTLDALISHLVTTLNVPIAVAAGNDNVDACASAPADSSVVFTVGASTQDDSRANFSNFGRCVNLFAPGTNVTSTWIPPWTTGMESGTSMASPHVAGMMALWIARYPDATPADVYAGLQRVATPGTVSDLQGSGDGLLYTGINPTNADLAWEGRRGGVAMWWDALKSWL